MYTPRSPVYPPPFHALSLSLSLICCVVCVVTYVYAYKLLWPSRLWNARARLKWTVNSGRAHTLQQQQQLNRVYAWFANGIYNENKSRGECVQRRTAHREDTRIVVRCWIVCPFHSSWRIITQTRNDDMPHILVVCAFSLTETHR